MNRVLLISHLSYNINKGENLIMQNTTKTKINCLLSVLISSIIWLFTFFYYFIVKEDNLYLPITFYFSILLQILAIILAVSAYKSSFRQPTRISSAICLIYSILSLILFLLINTFFMMENF